MQNHQLNPNLSSFLPSNYLNEMNENSVPLNSRNNNSNSLLHMRRSSLGNMNSYDENAFMRFNINNLSINQLKNNMPVSPIFSDTKSSNLFNNINEETFFESEKRSSSNFNFNSELASGQGLSNSYLLTQMIQQQQQQQNYSNKSSNYQYMSSPVSNNQNESNFVFPSPPSVTPRFSNQSNQTSVALTSSSKNNRRRSYHFGQINSLLQPVQESRAISPISSQQLKAQQQRELETNLNMLIYSNNLVNNQIPMQNPSLMTESQVNMMQANQQSNMPKQRMRAFSIGSGTLSNSMSSYLSDLSTNQELSMYQSKSMSNLNTTPSNSLINLRKFDSFEEKLATTGNIFQKRDDWSIINKLPVNKQNTIHMRLEDEGPFGNDEIRCFVLSHFSSLGIKELSCVFCDCNLIIYDRFPLIDGTLFLSPVVYDPKKAISTQLPNKIVEQQNNINGQQSQMQQYQTHKQSDLYQKKDKSQYIYAICLKCLMKEKDHDIKCKNCSKSWQTMGGNSLQIGTLYKYDIFAAFPCCQSRLNCNNCNSPIMNIGSDEIQFFSSYTYQKECNVCKIKDYHFIKPLTDIFIKQSCLQPVSDIDNPSNLDNLIDMKKRNEILGILNENEE